MNALLKNSMDKQIQDNQLLVAWLGLSGYVLKTSKPSFAVVDLYLSDHCEVLNGMYSKRVMPALMEPNDLDQLQLDLFISSHHDEDHLDIATVGAMNNPEVTFVSTPTSVRKLHEAGVQPDRCVALRDGDRYAKHGWSVHAVFADHGHYAPDAIGVIIQHGNVTVYHMGDTQFREEELTAIAQRFAIDLLLVPISGKFAVMNETEALQAVSILKPKYVSPMHFWMFPSNNGGDVLRFLEDVPKYSPASTVQLFTLGESFILQS